MHHLCLILACLWGAQSLAGELIWKRAKFLEQDLSRALSLTPEELCTELETYSCLKNVHLYALGGHDALGRAQYKPMAQPSQLSAIAFERVILGACIARIYKDRQNPEVFRFYPLDQKLQSVDRLAIQQQIRELYQRFLVRDPTPAEQSLLMGLAERFGERTAADVSQAFCLAVGSQQEFLFF